MAKMITIVATTICDKSLARPLNSHLSSAKPTHTKMVAETNSGKIIFDDTKAEILTLSSAKVLIPTKVISVIKKTTTPPPRGIGSLWSLRLASGRETKPTLIANRQ
ncbi:MAG: hypothetical protein FWD31_04125 [Planctomycetaceae bacterium]|nr:hypothetical protein [Planctomycetaceae bacterium]